MNKSQELYKQAKTIIPGGTQLFSKRPELFLPGIWPTYYKKAKGCEIWGLDNKKYIDMSYMGIGSCILGYANDNINSAVKNCIDNGSMSTLNCPEEVELAELLLKLHPWASKVRYARTGGEAMAIAVRLVRANSGKSLILFCGYHGWHDWYLSANLSGNEKLDGYLLPGLKPKGVPRELKGTTLSFNYNNLNEFKKLFKDNKNKIAAVIMEPIRSDYPKNGFLKKIRELTRKKGIPLIFDEVSSGFRLNNGGAHLVLGVNPDIAVFSKALANGFPMAAIIGNHTMDIAEESFISSTFWTERIGPVAAITTIKEFKKNNVHKHLERVGKRVQKGWVKLAKKHDLKINVSGIYPLSHFSFENDALLVLKTLFTQLMLDRGFLATTALYVSYAHKDNHIKKYFEAVDESFGFIKGALEQGNPIKYLSGGVCHSGFKRLA